MSAFGAALALAVLVLGLAGHGVPGTRLALQATARFSFLLFWLAYAGSPIATLFGPAFLPLKRNAPKFGLAFASAQLVHIGLIAWLCHLGAVPAIGTFVFFGVALFWLYAIAVFSVGNLLRRLHPVARQLLLFVGLNYIAYAFAVDFFHGPLHGGVRHILLYLPFAAMSAAGALLYFAALLTRLRQRSGKPELSVPFQAR